METVPFFKFPAAPAQEYTDLEKYFSQSGNNTELTETYISCLTKGELLVCKINHDQVSAEQKLGLTKVRPYLFLMLINPIAPTLTVPNRTVIPEGTIYAYTKTLLGKNWHSSHSCNFVKKLFFLNQTPSCIVFNVSTLYRKSIKLPHQKLW